MYDIWKPDVAITNDGLPLATSVRDLFYDFPYDSLHQSSVVAEIFKPFVVLGLVVCYWLSKPLLKFFVSTTGFDGNKSIVFKGLVALHNLGLCLFSAVTVFYSWPIVIKHVSDRGVFNTYCDPEHTLWNEAGFGAWATIFYVSKYYEFVDTWVLILKRKEPSFLQVYHHTGIVATMWGGVASQSAWLLFVVCLNSFIHTLMYAYFFIKTLFPKVHIQQARYLTSMQIGQFFTGILGSSGVLIMGESCAPAAARFSLVTLHIYGYGLIWLFMTMFKQKYKKKPAKTE